VPFKRADARVIQVLPASWGLTRISNMGCQVPGFRCLACLLNTNGWFFFAVYLRTVEILFS
jgi:hypothetical protein